MWLNNDQSGRLGTLEKRRRSDEWLDETHEGLKTERKYVTFHDAVKGLQVRLSRDPIQHRL